ncbi:MAG TPA: SMP-30/gluconolactonase/LRE family protein, partial [Vicinamibacterales bacterium]|nr:SMP-30/gluconolactonase/LRE family protein [Vicinamibacterales bacterium]
MRSTKLILISIAVLLSGSAVAFAQAPADKKGKGKAPQPPPLQNVRTTAIAGVVAADTPVQVVKEGFASTEGPVALPDGTFAFTETSEAKIHRIDANNNVSLYLENTNGANGLGFDSKGRLIAVQTVAGKTQVGPIGKSGPETALATSYNGKAFSRPNDLVVGRNGNIYFSDMGAGGSGVYRISAKGDLSQIDNQIERPNGVTLSPDEKTLYVANVGGEHVLAFDVAADGSVSKKRDFAKLADVTKDARGAMSSGADGLAIDAAGRLYVASNPGVQVFSSSGQALGVIPTPVRPQNIAFAGP